jgi:hypothetical protein
MATINTPNMNLPVPVVGEEIGPQWAEDINLCLGVSGNAIDGHNHSPGNGVLIQPNGLDISSDLTFQGNNATALRSTRFAPQLTNISGPADIGALYEVGVDLWYNDGNGVQIRLTQSGGPVGATGNITGLVSPASAVYDPISLSLIWQSGVNIPATMDAGSIIVRDLTSNTYGITVQAPTLTSNYSLTLPALPGVQSFMTLDASGIISAPWTVDNTTIKIVSNQLVVQPNALGIQEEHSWELNGNYPLLSYPLDNIDSIFFAPRNITIHSVWIYNGNAGTSGNTIYDLQQGTTPSGAFTSILSTKGVINSTALSTVWTDSGSVVAAQTGVTKPILGTTAINAGIGIKFTLLSSMTGTATDARIRIFYS